MRNHDQDEENTDKANEISEDDSVGRKTLQLIFNRESKNDDLVKTLVQENSKLSATQTRYMWIVIIVLIIGILALAGVGAAFKAGVFELSTINAKH
jgi:Na+/H+ antiporter NhaC